MSKTIPTIKIVDYLPSHKKGFIEINEAWITKSFFMEDIDRKELYNPEESILKGGGAILIALHNDKVIGTSALIKMDESTYELVKMAVDEKYRGNKIGRQLCLKSLEKAKMLGAKRVILYSNTKGSATAVKLYYELGFKEIPLGNALWERADIKMELEII